jgi:Domain of unknown function (DUF6265)
MKQILTLLAVFATSVTAYPAFAQSGKMSLSDVSWIAGCWKAGTEEKRVNNVEFWSKPVGNVMLGSGAEMSKTGKITSWEHMKIEAADDGKITLTIRSHNQKENVFTLADGKAEVLTFERTNPEFPQRVIYRKMKEGGLEIRVDGKVKDAQRAALYPMVRTPCE